jgi:hypothetical protein
MKLMLLACLFVLYSCAGYEPASKQDINTTFVEDTKLGKKDAFNKILTYLAKNLGNSNYAIQLKEQSQGKIVTKIATQCNELQASMDITTYTASFVLEVDVKDKKVRFNFEGDSYSQLNIDGAVLATANPFRTGQIEGLKKCATQLKNNIMESLNSSSDKW